MQKDFYFPSADGRTQLHGVAWVPQVAPRGVLQLCHGMVEFVARYAPFAEFLNAQGYYVVGHDHLGHGASVISEAEHGYFAQPNGNACVLQDLHSLRAKTQQQFPDLPYFMLGHSMGSFLLRQYVQAHGEGLAGAVIMGTGAQPTLLLQAGKALCRILAALHGWHYRSALVDGMALGAYNKAFAPARTAADWLSKDTAVVDAYCSHPWCSFRFTVNGYYNLFYSIQRAQSAQGIAQVPKALPLLLVAGACDPVGNNGKGVQAAFRAFQAAGLQQVQMKLYENDRHEILNATDRDRVYADLLAWLEANGHP